MREAIPDGYITLAVFIEEGYVIAHLIIQGKLAFLNKDHYQGRSEPLTGCTNGLLCFCIKIGAFLLVNRLSILINEANKILSQFLGTLKLGRNGCRVNLRLQTG
jgi:hypothetical protein